MRKIVKAPGTHITPSELFPAEPIQFICSGIDAEHHTPVYKMHRYFARRPHNVFRYLIESYTRPGDIILDCFVGGGVTLFEGLSTARKVIAVDINPLATFISDCQTTSISVQEYRCLMKQVWNEMHVLSERYYSTRCRRCGKPTPVRWYELAYSVDCPICGSRTLLSNEMKSGRSGRYHCQKCDQEFASINARRDGYNLISVIYRCGCTPGRQSESPVSEDQDSLEYFERNFDSLISEYDLWYPKDKIPADWDRQYEDGLHRREFFHFSDLFTRRSLFFNAYLLKCFQKYKGRVSPSLYKLLIFTFSAIIRYTNSMTFSATNWMDGRPIAWDKHAYWTPNQFVEVNPLEYVEKRRDAIVSGLRFQQQYLQNVKRVNKFEELRAGRGTHIIWTKSSDSLDIPDNSIDAIITDPPYGHNVQYGELSNYWLVWLQNEIPVGANAFSMDQEILVHRKTRGSARKSYDTYFVGLRNIFTECYRVLKPGGVLSFTFNNKDLKAWYAVIKAAIKAKFYLDPQGIIYQTPIENYKNTAHTRYAGSLHGDFIYTFRKTCHQLDSLNSARGKIDLPAIKLEVRRAAEKIIRDKGAATTSELYSEIIRNIIPILASVAESDKDFIQLNSEIGLDKLDSLLEQYLVQETETKLWHAKIRQERY